MKKAAQKALEAFKKIRACTVNVWDVDDEIKALEEALAKQEEQTSCDKHGEPVKFLANGMRFKITHTMNGGGNIHVPQSELAGRWVVLVAAEDDCHLKLKQPAQPKEEQGEPVAWIEHEWGGTGLRKLHFERHEPTVRDEVVNPIWTPLYTTPQQRTWVGLTDEEVMRVNTVREAEALLKEKNNG